MTDKTLFIENSLSKVAMCYPDPYEQNKIRFEATKDRNVFVIMRYAPGPPFPEIETAIRLYRGIENQTNGCSRLITLATDPSIGNNKKVL